MFSDITFCCRLMLRSELLLISITAIGLLSTWGLTHDFIIIMTRLESCQGELGFCHREALDEGCISWLIWEMVLYLLNRDCSKVIVIWVEAIYSARISKNVLFLFCCWRGCIFTVWITFEHFRSGWLNSISDLVRWD